MRQAIMRQAKEFLEPPGEKHETSKSLRDTGSGGIHGPLFRDGSFEYIPIPDNRGDDERTYGNTVGRKGVKLIEYFPAARRE